MASHDAFLEGTTLAVSRLVSGIKLDKKAHAPARQTGVHVSIPQAGGGHFLMYKDETAMKPTAPRTCITLHGYRYGYGNGGAKAHRQGEDPPQGHFRAQDQQAAAMRDDPGCSLKRLQIDRRIGSVHLADDNDLAQVEAKGGVSKRCTLRDQVTLHRNPPAIQRCLPRL
jgi:hypothetical protein